MKIARAPEDPIDDDQAHKARALSWGCGETESDLTGHREPHKVFQVAKTAAGIIRNGGSGDWIWRV